jgi:hypothetical protein
MKKTKLAFSAALGSVMTLAAIERPDGGEAAVPAEPQGGILEAERKEANGPEKAEEAQAAPAPEAVKKIAYLGEGGEEISEPLKLHLELEKGLLLVTVDPNSPAGLSGLKEHDILLFLDDAELTDQESLRAIISKHQPGDVVALKLIRRGKEIEQEVTLGAAPVNRDIPPMALVPNPAAEMNRMLNERLGLRFDDFDNDGFEKELMDQLRKALGDRGNNLGPGVFPQLRFEIPGDDEGMGEGFHAFGSVNLKDEEGSVEMKTRGGKRTVIVRDPAGEVLFEGPYNTDEEKKAVPEDLRHRVEKLDLGNGAGGFRFNFRGFDRADEPKKEGN